VIFVLKQGNNHQAEQRVSGDKTCLTQVTFLSQVNSAEEQTHQDGLRVVKGERWRV